MILTMGGFYLKASESYEYDVDGVHGLLLKGDVYNEVAKQITKIIEVLRGPLIDEVV